MIFHVCSHFGDIEILPLMEQPGHSLVRYLRLTPTEKEALERLIAMYPDVTPPTEYSQGEVVLPANLLEVAGKLGIALHPDKVLITAVKFADASISVTRERNWWRKLFGIQNVQTFGGYPWVKQEGETQPPHTPQPPDPAAAVQVTMPKRGCPMPTATELKEAKAAAVVRKFLTPQQQKDFDNHRAFVAVGNWSGHLYRITSRWNPECQKLGVLRDMTQNMSVCASNLDVPPSEEILAMKFAVENYERPFRNGGRFGNDFHLASSDDLH